MKFKLICFDVYSALMDIEGSIAPQLGNFIRANDEKLLTMFRLWRTTQWNYLLLNNSMDVGFEPYEYITLQALDYTLKKNKMELDQADKEELVKCWSRLNPWPEVKDTLAEIKNRGYKIAILSNGDDDMLKGMADYAGIEFDYIFSADRAQAYKPSPKIYKLPFKELGLSNDEVLHVAGSSFDTMGAIAAGLTVAWSNRFNDFTLDSKYRPEYVLNNLSELLNIL